MTVEQPEPRIAITAARSMPTERMIRRLEETYGLPARIVADDGPAFTSRAMQGWAHDPVIESRFIEPGKRTQASSSEE